MAKKLSTNTITAGDIRRRHPRYLTCETDRQYAQLANDIYDMMNEELAFMEEREIRNASISLALYFEDMRSGTHQFEAFAHLYKKMYGYYLPYYNTMDASDSSAPLDAMRFMLWHSICAERDGRMVNPTNDGLAGMAVKLAQDNLEFMARCMRRDIVCDNVVRQRTDTLDAFEDGSALSRYDNKYPYEKFVELIAEES
jgi:hypothetical protein